MDETRRPTVLLVEDEPEVVDSLELMLEGDYDIRKANDGEQALETINTDVDVVLLDRMMPGMSGSEVLREIRDRELDCRVAMVTAVDPDFDIIEMGFDAYIKKPPSRAELKQTIDELLSRSSYGETLQGYHSLLSKRSALQVEKSVADLEKSDEYAHLEDRIAELEGKLDESTDQFLDDTAFVGALRDLAGDEEVEQ